MVFPICGTCPSDNLTCEHKKTFSLSVRFTFTSCIANLGAYPLARKLDDHCHQWKLHFHVAIWGKIHNTQRRDVHCKSDNKKLRKQILNLDESQSQFLLFHTHTVNNICGVGRSASMCKWKVFKLVWVGFFKFLLWPFIVIQSLI